MIIQKNKFLFLIIVFITFFSMRITAQLQYINEQGLAQGLVADVIKALEIDLSVYQESNSNLPAHHIINIHNFLKIFYQENRDFYRRGGKCFYVLTSDQAQKITQLVRGSYAMFNTQDPIEKKRADVLIFSGFDRSLEKRIHSYKKFLEEGYRCNRVFFISGNQALEDCVKKSLEKHKELFASVTINLVQASHDGTYQEDFILKVKPFISQDFYLVSDPEYALALKEACISYGAKNGLNCLGVFVRSITNDPDEYVLQELKAYKFDEYIPNSQDQIVAAAYSSLNILAHQVAQEIILFKKGFTCQHVKP